MLLLVLQREVEHLSRYKQSNMFIAVHGSSIFKISILMVLFLFTLLSISAALTSLKPGYRPSSTTVNEAAANVTGEMLYQLIGKENHHLLRGLPIDQQAPPGLTKLLFSLSTNISLDDPRSLLGRELPGFSFFDSQIIVAGDGTNYTNMPHESSPPLEVLLAEQEAALQNLEAIEKNPDNNQIATPQQTTGDKNVVYIYFSHTRESFLPHLKGVTDPNAAHHSKVNVTQVGEKLKDELIHRGIGTTVDQTDIISRLNDREKKYWQAYDESRLVVEAAMTNNRDLTYFIDIHRDSKRKNATTISLNGKSYAKLAFVIGKKHPHYEKNIRLANELHEGLQKKYPGLSRGVLAKGEKGDNGKYNQDLSSNAILLEFGGVDNTFEELNRTAAAFADVFSELYWQAEEVNK